MNSGESKDKSIIKVYYLNGKRYCYSYWMSIDNHTTYDESLMKSHKCEPDDFMVKHYKRCYVCPEGPAGTEEPAGPTGPAGPEEPAGPAGTNGTIRTIRINGTSRTIRTGRTNRSKWL